MLSHGPSNGSNGARSIISIFGESPGQLFDPIARRMSSIPGLEHQVPIISQLENSPICVQCRELQNQLRMGAGTDPAAIVSGFIKAYASRDYEIPKGSRADDPKVKIENFIRFYDRGMIVESLARVLPSHKEVTAALCDAALAASGSERECAIRILAKGQQNSPRTALLSENQLSSLVPLLRDPELTDEAFLSLAQILAGRSSSPAVLPGFIDGFSRFHRFESAEIHRRQLLIPHGSQCIEHALTAIKLAPRATVLDSLTTGLRSENPRVFIGTTALLRELSERTLPNKEQLLQDVFTLSKEGFVQKITSSPSVSVKAGAIDCLGDFGMRASALLPLLIEQSDSPHRLVKAASLRSIGKIGGAVDKVIAFYVEKFPKVVSPESNGDSETVSHRGEGMLVKSLLEGVAACLPGDAAVQLMKISLLHRSPLVAEAAIEVLKKAHLSWRTAEPLFEAAWDPLRLDDSTLSAAAVMNINSLITLAGQRFGRDAIPALDRLQHQLNERLGSSEFIQTDSRRYNEARIATVSSINTARLIGS